MSRSDLRLVIAIVSTGALAAIGGALLTRKLAPEPVVDTSALEHRIEVLEQAVQTQMVHLGNLDEQIARLENPPPPPPVADEQIIDDCDEVSCVLNNYEGACCTKFKRGHADALDRSMIADGIGKIKSQVAACGDKSSAKGKVKVHVKVKPDGTVSAVTVTDTPDVDLANCVAGVIQHAHFAATHDGGSFGYPFIF